MNNGEQDPHLRPLCINDLSLVLKWRNTCRIRINMYNDKIISPIEHKKWFDNLKVNKENVYLIFELKKCPVGLVSFKNIDLINKKCRWGFYLGEEGLPKGTGYTMGILGLEYAFQKLSIRKLCGEVFAFNEQSIRFHKKLGFGQEGRFIKHVLKNDNYEDIIYFALFKEDWERQRQRQGS